jgi:hypothetical protein
MITPAARVRTEKPHSRGRDAVNVLGDAKIVIEDDN